MPQRRRSRGKLDDEDTTKSVVLLSSSDDEADKDLTLEIIERAEKRLKASQELKRAIDFSDDEHEITGEAKQKRKNRVKKKAAKGKHQSIAEVADKENEPIGTAESVVTELNEMNNVLGATKILNDDTFDVFPLEEVPLEKPELIVSNILDASNNVILRKLLRGPRYFDTGEQSWGSCYNCGEEGHQAFNCTKEKRQKPCFMCGMFGHSSKNCMQGQDCFICKRRGHLAKECPDKKYLDAQDSKLCLRCGDAGHDMSTCKNEYVPDDLKEIQCYVCQKLGHLCCVNFMDSGSSLASCYNCAQFGHSGAGCAKPRGEAKVDRTPTLCYRCGEEGHFARGCTNKTKSARFTDTLFASQQQHFNESPKKWSKSKRSKERGLKSVPKSFEKKNRHKSPHSRKSNDGFSKSKVRGRWVVDDPGDYWESPRSSAKRSSNSYHSTSGRNHASPRKHKPLVTSYTPSSCYKPAIAASRFGTSYSR